YKFGTCVFLSWVFNLNVSWSQNKSADTVNKKSPMESDITRKATNDTGLNNSDSITLVQVVDAYKLGTDDIKDKKEKNSAGIGDIIIVKVKNLKTLLARSKCVDKNGK